MAITKVKYVLPDDPAGTGANITRIVQSEFIVIDTVVPGISGKKPRGRVQLMSSNSGSGSSFFEVKPNRIITQLSALPSGVNLQSPVSGAYTVWTDCQIGIHDTKLYYIQYQAGLPKTIANKMSSYDGYIFGASDVLYLEINSAGNWVKIYY